MLLKVERHRKIIDWLDQESSLSVDDLQNRLQVSSMTVWRDLDYLEQKGFLQRFRGGVAKKGTDAKVEPFFESKQIIHRERKAAIAHYAAENFVCENEIIILEGGTTVACMVAFLKQHNLTLLTNGLDVLNRAANFLPRLTVMGCGGILRDKSRTFVGPEAESFFSAFHANKFFLGATGFDLEVGITDPSPLEIQIKRAMQKNAEKTILLLDSSKFAVRSLSQIVPLQSVDVLLTDEFAPDKILDEVRAAGVEVHVVRVQPNP